MVVLSGGGGAVAEFSVGRVTLWCWFSVVGGGGRVRELVKLVVVKIVEGSVRYAFMQYLYRST